MTQKTFKVQMITNEGEFQWAFVDKPKANAADPSKPPKYSITFLMDKKDPSTKKKLIEVDACISDALEKFFGDKKPAKFHNPIKDGDVETDANGVPKYPNNWYFEAKSSTKPGLVDADRNEILEANAVWSGCRGRLSIGFGAYDVSSTKGVTIYLNNIQLLNNSAPRPGGRKPAEEDFDD